MRILILFGSQSDTPIYGPLKRELEELQNIQCQLEVLSAHRNPLELDKRLQQADFDLIVAGAGLAAHLPGVVASKVSVPVIGVPVASYFLGLDAFASILQMPFPIPVLTVGANQIKAVVQFIQTYSIYFDYDTPKELSQIDLLLPTESETHSDSVNQELERMQKYADQQKIKLFPTKQQSVDTPTIKIVTTGAGIESGLVINLPVVNSTEREDPNTMIRVMQQCKEGGVWMGVNNGRNAIVAWQKLFKS
jgi:5-(carboxyamino)imidazole ribonucleotide mutase